MLLSEESVQFFLFYVPCPSEQHHHSLRKFLNTQETKLETT